MGFILLLLTIVGFSNPILSQSYGVGNKNPKIPSPDGCQIGKDFYSPRQNIHDLFSCRDKCKCDLNEENDYEIICQSQRVCPFEDPRCVGSQLDTCGCLHCDITFDSYVNFNTNRFYQYVYHPYPLKTTEGGIFLNFRVNTRKDAYIALSPQPHDSDPMYVIGMGIYANRLSVIRRCKDCPSVEWRVTKAILNGGKTTDFWLSYVNGQLAVGRAGEPSFISYTDVNPIDVRYIGMASWWGSTGFWEIAELDSKSNDPNFRLSEFTAYVSLSTTTNEYVYIDNRLVSERLEFYIKASSDVILLLSPNKVKDGEAGEVYRIVIAYGPNGRSTLAHCHSKEDCEIKASATTHSILSANTARGFWLVFHRSGLVEVGQENKKPFLKWQDPYALAVTYFGYATTDGGYAAIDFSIVEVPLSFHQLAEFLAPYDVKTSSNDYVYLDYSFGSDRRLEFYVTAETDVYISLSPFQDDTEFYQIILAVGSEGVSTLSHCFNKDDCHVKAKTITKDVLPGTREGFWIIFDPAGQVEVGRAGFSAFIAWEDPYPLMINHLGYATIPNGNAELQFNLKESKSAKYEIENFRNPLTFTSTTDDYVFLDHKLKDRTVKFFIESNGDVNIALGPYPSGGEFYRIILAHGADANSTLSHCDENDCHIKAWAITYDILSNTESRGFWIKFNPDGKVDVGRDGYTAFMSWQDPYPLPTNFIGYAGVDGGRLEIIFDKRDFEDCSGVTEVVATSTNLNYLDTIVTSNSVRFFATGNGDVMISLGPFDNGTEFYLIVIAPGAYSTSTLSHCFSGVDDCLEKASVTNANVFHAGKRTGFLVNFDPLGKVEVSLIGDPVSFLYWQEPYPLNINHIGYGVQNGLSMTYEFCKENWL